MQVIANNLGNINQNCKKKNCIYASLSNRARRPLNVDRCNAVISVYEWKCMDAFKKKHFSSKKAHLFIYRFKLPIPYKSLSKVRTSEFCHAIHAVNHAVNHAVLRNWRQTVSWTNLSPRLRIRFLPDFLEAIALYMKCQNEKEMIIKSIKSHTVQTLTNLFTT